MTFLCISDRLSDEVTVAEKQHNLILTTYLMLSNCVIMIMKNFNSLENS